MELPAQANYTTVCAARINEIKAIEKELAKCEHGQRAFQKLPRNMQRRAVSSNPQRLPLYMREKHKREIGNKIKVSKRPSRKYRRRPSNLMSEYNRRQREFVWLETHIWHAKRFHMTREWGYCFPKTPTKKSFRASIRAASDTCLIQDVSYECTLEIESSYEEIKACLKSMTSEDEWTKLERRTFQSGLTWISLFLFEPNLYPLKALGRAQLIASNDFDCDFPQKIWISVHPSIYNDVLSSLVQFLKLSEDKNNDCEIKKESDIRSDFKKYITSPKFTSPSITLSVLKDTLVKFRLTGARSYNTICDTLVPITVSSGDTGEGNKGKVPITVSSGDTGEDNKGKVPITVSSGDTGEGNKGKADGIWWKDFYSDRSNIDTLNDQISLLNSLRNHHQSSSCSVCSFIIRDPRAILPVKKKSLLKSEDLPLSYSTADVVKKLRTHPIFSASIRKSVSFTLETTSELNKRRSHLLLPGSPLPVSAFESRIPVLLLQRPGSHVNPELGQGWDVFLPSGCGTAALVSFVMNGAAVGGQDQEQSLQTEFLLPLNPDSIPDTKAGREFALREEEEKKKEYFKRPPKCRVNYIKLGVRFPFSVNWVELIQSWEPCCSEFFVLRNRNLLQKLARITCPKINKLQSTTKPKRLKLDEKNSSKIVEKDCDSLMSSQFNNEHEMFQFSLSGFKYSLIYVRLIIINKGSLGPLSMIALPTENDLKSFLSKESLEIYEPVHKDQNMKERERLKCDHERKINNLRKKRKRARKKAVSEEDKHRPSGKNIQELLSSSVDDVNKENEELIKDIKTYSSRINELWLQNNADVPFQCCSRKIIGFLTQGGFCSQVGRSAGVGFVAGRPFLSYLKQLNLIKTTDAHNQSSLNEEDFLDYEWKNQAFVLVREKASFLYRWARIIVLDI